MDTLSKKQRSERMSLVRSSNTEPERICRSILSDLGYRFKLNVVTLPGSPDVVFPRLKRIIFVHGCFWHGHPGCGRLPKSRSEFWVPKIIANRKRDSRLVRQLRRAGWGVMTVWECQLKNRDRLTRRFKNDLKNNKL